MLTAEVIQGTINFLKSIDEDIAQFTKRIEAEEKGPQESVNERMRRQAYECRAILYNHLAKFYTDNISTEKLIKDTQREIAD